MTSSHAGTPQARAKIHTTLTDFEIALPNLTGGGRLTTVNQSCAFMLGPFCRAYAPKYLPRAHPVQPHGSSTVVPTLWSD